MKFRRRITGILQLGGYLSTSGKVFSGLLLVHFLPVQRLELRMTVSSLSIAVVIYGRICLELNEFKNLPVSSTA